MALLKYGLNGYVQCGRCNNDAPTTNARHPELCLDCFYLVTATPQAEHDYLVSIGEVPPALPERDAGDYVAL